MRLNTPSMNNPRRERWCRSLLDSTFKSIVAEGRPRNRGKSTSELWRHARCLGGRPWKKAASTRVCTQIFEFSATPDDDPEALAASAEPDAFPAVADRWHVFSAVAERHDFTLLQPMHSGFAFLLNTPRHLQCWILVLEQSEKFKFKMQPLLGSAWDRGVLHDS